MNAAEMKAECEREPDPRDAQIAALCEALKPFADAADIDEDVPDDAGTFLHDGGTVTAGDFRRARRALAATELKG